MDAMPIDLADELSAWSSQLKTSLKSLKFIEARLLELPQGGTAVGTGINAHKRFAKVFAQEISRLSGNKYTSVASDNSFMS